VSMGQLIRHTAAAIQSIFAHVMLFPGVQQALS